MNQEPSKVIHENKNLVPFTNPCIIFPNIVPNFQPNCNPLIINNLQIPVAISSVPMSSLINSLQINQKLQKFFDFHSFSKMSQYKKGKVLKNLNEQLKKKMILNTRFTKNQKKMIQQYNLSIDMMSISNEQIEPKCQNESIKNRVPFSIEEDEKIKRLVEKYGKRNWQIIASFIKERTPKQCRDRYCNYLFPGFFGGEWSKEEDDLLMKLYSELGPKWSVIKKSFVDRSTNSLKNRWIYFLSKQNKSKNDISENESDENDDDVENDIDPSPISNNNLGPLNSSNNQNLTFENVYNNSNFEDDWILF